MSAAIAVPASVVGDLRRARRRQRVAAIHWVDALYQVYITGILVAGAVLALSTIVGDAPLSAAAIARVRADGPAVLGVVAAVAVFVGLRSGSRGGPLAVEAADVRHVLLAPVDRGAALRSPALRQLRFAAFTAVAVGAAGGQFAGRRFEGSGPAWVACGALFALCVVGLGLGAALVASGRRLPSWVATLSGGVLVAWAIADVATDRVPAGPAAAVGHIALWPLGFDAVGLLPLAAALALVVTGLAGVAGVSLEAAERRTSLVGQLRFAVTLQDLRTVLVLRRQLAADLPRSRPWVRTLRRPGRAYFPVWQRGWRGVARWPAARLVRLVVLAVVAGLALRGIWTGTTPLVVVAGLALWIAALDAVEPLAQETDHPGRRDALPLEEGRLMVRHLGVPVVVMVVVAAAAAGVSLVAGGSTPEAEAMAAGVVPMAMAAVAGAVTSVLMGAPKPFDQLAVASPEIAGMRTAMRTVWPPMLAVLGVVPVLVARAAAEGRRPVLDAAAVSGAVVLGVAFLVGAWVRYRADITAWWAAASEAAMKGNPTGQPDDEVLDDEAADDEDDRQERAGSR